MNTGDPDFVLGPGTRIPLVLIVEYADGQERRFEAADGWQVEIRNGVSLLVIGRSTPRTYIPLGNVLSILDAPNGG